MVVQTAAYDGSWTRYNSGHPQAEIGSELRTGEIHWTGLEACPTLEIVDGVAAGASADGSPGADGDVVGDEAG